MATTRKGGKKATKKSTKEKATAKTKAKVTKKGTSKKGTSKKATEKDKPKRLGAALAARQVLKRKRNKQTHIKDIVAGAAEIVAKDNGTTAEDLLSGKKFDEAVRASVYENTKKPEEKRRWIKHGKGFFTLTEKGLAAT